MNLLLVASVMVSVFSTVMWLGHIWVVGAEAYDGTE